MIPEDTCHPVPESISVFNESIGFFRVDLARTVLKVMSMSVDPVMPALRFESSREMYTPMIYFWGPLVGLTF